MRLKYMSPEERERRVRLFTSGVMTLTRKSASADKPVRTLSDAAVKMLIKAALEPGCRLLEVYEDLGLHPAEGKKALDELSALGYIRLHALQRMGRGNQPRVIEVISPGLAELEKRGIKPAEKRLKRGGWVHDVYAREVEAWAKANGYRRVEFERWLGGKAFDLMLEHEDGRFVGVEVVLSGTAQWNASQALKAASVDGVERVVIACADRKLMKGIERELKDQDALGLYRGKIEVRSLGEYVRV